MAHITLIVSKRETMGPILDFIDNKGYSNNKINYILRITELSNLALKNTEVSVIFTDSWQH